MSLSLKEHNTLHLAHTCNELIVANNTDELVHACRRVAKLKQPFLILGGGSNIVFTTDFSGAVIKVASRGIEVSEDDEFYYLSVAAGEDWHELVKYSLKQGMPGLENLALIPGTVGAAPIQNIGAYGGEFKHFCDWVKYYDIDSNKLNLIRAEECKFGYRESTFKHQLKHNAVIVEVGLKLSKCWQPVCDYGPLQDFDVTTVTATEIFDRVCEVRKSKLPDPCELGNVGSFFKNPVVSESYYQELLKCYPNLVAYPVTDGVKLAAGWLIEQAGLKGHRDNVVGVHEKQALVLVNYGDAQGGQIMALANQITSSVFNMFGVNLEVEPRLIGKYGEIEFHG